MLFCDYCKKEVISVSENDILYCGQCARQISVQYSQKVVHFNDSKINPIGKTFNVVFGNVYKATQCNIFEKLLYKTPIKSRHILNIILKLYVVMSKNGTMKRQNNASTFYIAIFMEYAVNTMHVYKNEIENYMTRKEIVTMLDIRINIDGENIPKKEKMERKSNKKEFNKLQKKVSNALRELDIYIDAYYPTCIELIDMKKHKILNKHLTETENQQLIEILYNTKSQGSFKNIYNRYVKKFIKEKVQEDKNKKLKELKE